MAKNTLEEYSKLITKDYCDPCMKADRDADGNYGTELDISPGNIEHYDHDGGWEVEGFDEKQWLYIVCPACKYQWALWKLGVPR